MARAVAYYNEIDPYAADWLRNLIAAGHIAPGDVDERSIEDVHPDDLRPYTQCHFFAGIGVWSYALRRAGWPDDRPVWTGSCPCQPFSAAGKGTAFDDERHLWPAWHWLIQECRPPVVFGEQVASKDAEPWLDLVSTDLEALVYAVSACAFPSASIGAPHIRDRTYFVAYANHDRRTAPSLDRGHHAKHHTQPRGESRGMALPQYGGLEAGQSERRRAGAVVPPSAAGGMGNAADQPCQRDAGGVSRAKASEHGARVGIDGSQPVRPEHAGASVVRGMADTDGRHAGAERKQRGGEQRQQPEDSGTGDLANATGGGRREERADAGRRHVGDLPQGVAAGSSAGGSDLRPGPVNGFWRAADWLLCRDGKWRPVEPGTFPLAHGAPARVGRLRAYGNAINAQQAQIFIEESMRCI
ncbi:DNA cytosine methyltransferase [Achromobacter sp. KK8]